MWTDVNDRLPDTDRSVLACVVSEQECVSHQVAYVAEDEGVRPD